MLHSLYRAESFVERHSHLRKLVKVHCDIYTQSSDYTTICIDGRFIFVPAKDLDEVVREDPRKDGGSRGFVVIPKDFADQNYIPYVNVR